MHSAHVAHLIKQYKVRQICGQEEEHDEGHARVDDPREVLARVDQLAPNVIRLVPPVEGPKPRVQRECEG